MIENIKRFIGEHQTLIVVVISVLVIYFLYWWFCCKDIPSANKVKGGANFTWFPFDNNGMNDFTVFRIPNSTLAGKDYEAFSNAIDLIKRIRENPDNIEVYECATSFEHGSWDLEFYFGFYEYDATHHGFPWIKIGVASRNRSFEIGEEASTHPDLLKMGILGGFGFFASTNLGNADICSLNLLNNRDFLYLIFNRIRLLENYCHDLLIQKLSRVIRLGGTTTGHLAGLVSRAQQNKIESLRALARESIMNMITDGESLIDSTGECFVFDYFNSFGGTPGQGVDINYFKNQIDQWLRQIAFWATIRLGEVNKRYKSIFHYSGIDNFSPIYQINFESTEPTFSIHPFTYMEMEQYRRSFLSVIPGAPTALDAEDGPDFINTGSHFKFDSGTSGKQTFEDSYFDEPSSEPAFANYGKSQDQEMGFKESVDLMNYLNGYPNMGSDNFVKTSHAPQSLNRFSNKKCGEMVSFLTEAVRLDETVPYPSKKLAYHKLISIPRKKSSHKPPIMGEVDTNNCYLRPYRPMFCSPPYDRLDRRDILHGKDEVYVIDPNDHDLWEGVIDSELENDSYKIHFPDFPEDDCSVHRSRILRRTQRNKAFYDMFEKKKSIEVSDGDGDDDEEFVEGGEEEEEGED